jgi:hypothetical protein
MRAEQQALQDMKRPLSSGKEQSNAKHTAAQQNSHSKQDTQSEPAVPTHYGTQECLSHLNT